MLRKPLVTDMERPQIGRTCARCAAEMDNFTTGCIGCKNRHSARRIRRRTRGGA